MSQFDFGTIDPNTKSGTALASDLNSFRTALHTSHSGSTAPSYITTGMLWVDSTSANLKIKMYDGAQSIDVAIIDATNNVARVAVDSAATSYITSTVAAQIKFVVASVDTATIRSTGLQFNIASPFIGDSSNNELISFSTTASAVNQINIANAATGANPVISAIGNDTNIGITLTPKGTGRTNIGQLALDGTTITTTAAQLNFVTGVTSAVQTQLDAKAPLASPALTGTPTAPTAAVGTNTTQIATTAFVLANSGPDTQTFSASGTWTKPTGAQLVLVRLVNGGAGGQGGATASGGAGGDGSGVSEQYFLASALTATVVVTLGAGGTGGAAGGGAGGAGGSTIFTGYMRGAGGAFVGGEQGSGGLLATASSEYFGGGGGGGGAGSTTSSGRVGAANTPRSTAGGSGGDGTTGGAGGVGGAGTGGGGGGGNSTAAGGSGGAGSFPGGGGGGGGRGTTVGGTGGLGGGGYAEILTW